MVIEVLKGYNGKIVAREIAKIIIKKYPNYAENKRDNIKYKDDIYDKKLIVQIAAEIGRYGPKLEKKGVTINNDDSPITFFLDRNELPLGKPARYQEANALGESGTDPRANFEITFSTNHMTDINDKINGDEIFDEDEKIEVKKNERIVHYEPLNPDIKTLYDNWKNGDLVLEPDFQRKFVWDEQKASNLIESILLKIPIPIIYTAEDNGIEEIVDGQQRLTSIFSFIEGKFPNGKAFKLRKLKILDELGGKSFTELPEIHRKAILKRGLTVVKILAQSNEDIKFEMFERLNTNITKLNAQELRNCMYRGEYNEFIKRLAKNEDFQYILNKPDASRRMYDCELVLLFLAFCNKNFDLYKGNMSQFLNDEMRRNRTIGSSERAELEVIFKKSVDLIRVIFGKYAFNVFSMLDLTKWNLKNEGKFESRIINQGLFLILMYGFINYSKNQIISYADLIREELLNLQIHNAMSFS